MNRFLGLLLHPVTLTALALLMLALLVWFFGPLIAIADKHPLDGMLERAITIGVIVLVVVGVKLLREWRRRRTNAELVAGMAAGPSAAEREGQALEQRFKEALKILEDSARQSGKRSFLQRGQYLYELPWYMFIGAPGSGKTTALMNAGLTFPLAGKMGQASVRGVGGTRNCEWWFTDEAVLIDTAGRYALQQSDEATDAAAWKTFLSLLKKSRPRRPVNGVLLTVNVQDLLQQPPAERREHALRLRTRLQELHQQLGVRPPVYVLVTKCDLVAGFNETFGEMGREEREQVWGFTFPYDDSPAAAAATPLQEFASEFAALETRLRERLIERMEVETDVLKRAAIFAFPQQFAGLKGLLGGFLEQVFEGGAGLEQRALVRGVYFTSGTQEGTPIDRVLGTLGRTFGVDGRVAALAPTRGKSFFLTRLLREVVFREQGLVGVNRQAEARRRQLRLAAVAAMGVVAVVAVGGWGTSFMRNQSYLAEVDARVPELQAAVATLPPATSAELSVLPQVLDEAVALPAPSTFELDAPPLLNTLGLYEGRHVAAGADIAYRRLLDKALLPRVTKRLEERLRAASRDNLELAYESLKHYLMLYTPEHFDAESLKAFVTLDWDANLAGTLSAEQRQALAGHLDAAFSRGAPPPAAPMDEALVASVREMLAAYPLEYRIFSRLKRARVGADIADFSVASAAGPNAVRVFERASGQPLTQGIPGLFTRDGYFKAFQSAQSAVAATLAKEQAWVIGTPAAQGTAQRTAQAAAAALGGGASELDQKVRLLYLQEYIKVWDRYLADVRLIRLGNLENSMAVAGLLAAPDSPLRAYLRGVARETQLAAAIAEAAAANAPATAVGARMDRAKQEMAALLGSAAGVPTAGAAGRPIEAMVDDHFASIHRMVAGQPAPIDDVLKLFNEINVQLTAIDAAQKSRTAPPPGGGAAIKAAAALQPEPIKSMLESLVDAGATQGRSAERQGLTAELRPIAELCMRTIAGRYPFAQGSKSDVMPDDFGQMFGVGGQLDEFFQRRLAGLVDTGANPWAFRPLPDGTKPPGGAALADFQRAARIREAFFRTGGKVPGFKVDLRVLEMSDGLKEVVIDVDGSPMKFTAGDTAPQTFTWPSARIASQIKLGGGPGAAVQTFEGPWAFFRMLGQFEVQPSTQPERFTVVLNLEGRKARMEVISGSALNPLRLREMQGFRCPETL
jgi:type VI secretion system protein ImpL